MFHTPWFRCLAIWLRLLPTLLIFLSSSRISCSSWMIGWNTGIFCPVTDRLIYSETDSCAAFALCSRTDYCSSVNLKPTNLSFAGGRSFFFLPRISCTSFWWRDFSKTVTVTDRSRRSVQEGLGSRYPQQDACLQNSWNEFLLNKENLALRKIRKIPSLI